MCSFSDVDPSLGSVVNAECKRIKIFYNLWRASFRSDKKAGFSDLSVNLTEFPIVAAHENETSAYCFSLTLPLQNWNIEIQNCSSQIPHGRPRDLF